MNIKNQAVSIGNRLSNLAEKLNIPYQHIATSFLLERLVVRLTFDKKLRDRLVFKGGYVGLRVYESNRYTVDLDALLMKADLNATLALTRAAAEEDVGDAVWFKFENQVNLKTQGEYGGIRQVFRAGIGEKLKDIRRARIINFDIGIGDVVTPGPIAVETPELVGENELSWRVYPIETIIAEKIHALVVRGADNSRSKDIFDLMHFLPKADSKTFCKAIKACFEFRATALPENLVLHLSQVDLSLLKRGWPSAVATVKKPPTCEDAFKKLLESLAVHLEYL